MPCLATSAKREPRKQPLLCKAICVAGGNAAGQLRPDDQSPAIAGGPRSRSPPQGARSSPARGGGAGGDGGGGRRNEGSLTAPSVWQAPATSPLRGRIERSRRPRRARGESRLAPPWKGGAGGGSASASSNTRCSIGPPHPRTFPFREGRVGGNDTLPVREERAHSNGYPSIKIAPRRYGCPRPRPRSHPPRR